MRCKKFDSKKFLEYHEKMIFQKIKISLKNRKAEMSGLTSGAPEPGIRTYNSQVRVGNWNEDICLEEDLLKGYNLMTSNDLKS